MCKLFLNYLLKKTKIHQLKSKQKLNFLLIILLPTSRSAKQPIKTTVRTQILNLQIYLGQEHYILLFESFQLLINLQLYFSQVYIYSSQTFVYCCRLWLLFNFFMNTFLLLLLDHLRDCKWTVNFRVKKQFILIV